MSITTEANEALGRRAEQEKEETPNRLLQDGYVIGKWRILSLIGKGGNGEVYRVENVDTGAVGAFKVLVNDNPVALARFELESEILRRIAESGDPAARCFPRLLASGCYGSEIHPFVVTEFLHPYELPRRDAGVAKFITRMCDAVSLLHHCGYLHRDIKKENILCRDRDEPVLIDFGAAVRRENLLAPISDRVSFVREAGQLEGTGTLGATAPEQVLSPDRDCVQSDVYALGTLTSECFHKHPPRNWEPIILKATDASFSDRYENPDALADAIDRRERPSRWTVVGRTAWICGIIGFALALYRLYPTSATEKALDADSEGRLGLMLLHGAEMKKDLKEAARHLENAAKKGNLEAQLVYAKMNLFGQGVRVDLSLARKYYEMAEAKGSLEAMYYLGWLDVLADREELSIPTMPDFMLSCGSNNVRIASAMRKGYPFAALMCVRRSVLRDKAKVETIFGGLAKDFEDSRTLRPEEKAFGQALCLRELDYWRSRAEHDKTIAELMKKAAQEGSLDAALWLADCYPFCTASGGKDEYEQVYWAQKLATDGVPAAQYVLGECYSGGVGGLPSDAEKAIDCYMKAARQGVYDAMLAIGQLYENDKKVKDTDKAFEWYLKASEYSFLANASIASMFRKGEAPVVTYFANLNEELSLGASIWNRRQELALGIMFEYGLGVPVDSKEACRWYGMAAKDGVVSAARYMRMLGASSK